MNQTKEHTANNPTFFTTRFSATWKLATHVVIEILRTADKATIACIEWAFKMSNVAYIEKCGSDILSDEDEHDSIKCRRRRGFKHKASCNKDGVYARKRFGEVKAKDAQTDEKKDKQGQEQEHPIQGREGLSNITHRPRQDAALPVDLYDRHLYLCPRYVSMIIFIEHAKSSFSQGLVVVYWIKVGWE
jgi:hypothetical protein